MKKTIVGLICIILAVGLMIGGIMLLLRDKPSTPSTSTSTTTSPTPSTSDNGQDKPIEGGTSEIDWW
ncbi:MAG: hypothetical protein J6R42_05380 [Clostridia bacterium]|nr:hypothetical protein [Clostridia bacterium]